MKIKSYVGGHDISIYENCEYDSSKRKYFGGSLYATIPFSGKLLNVHYQIDDILTLEFNDLSIQVKTKPKILSVDSPPDSQECDFFVVSAAYAAACKSLGLDTSRMLTIGDTVIDKDGRVIGCINFSRC